MSVPLVWRHVLSRLATQPRTRLAYRWTRSGRAGAGRLRHILGVVAMSAVATLPVRAMEYSSVVVSGNVPALSLSGEILPGDTGRLLAFLARLPPGGTVARLILDSPGGNLAEADKLASLIHQAGMPVMVLADGECASACFLLFAASPSRYASPSAQIGVHSGSLLYGDENLLTIDITTMMAREASEFGVPPDVIGRMVTTKPSEMAWLTSDERREMNVRVLPAGSSDIVGAPEPPKLRPGRRIFPTE